MSSEIPHISRFDPDPVVNAVLIGNLQPIFIVMMGFLVLREES